MRPSPVEAPRNVFDMLPLSPQDMHASAAAAAEAMQQQQQLYIYQLAAAVQQSSTDAAARGVPQAAHSMDAASLALAALSQRVPSTIV